MIRRLLKSRLNEISSSEDEDRSLNSLDASNSAASTNDSISEILPTSYRGSDLQDGINKDEFYQSIDEQVAAIETEMITYGDDKLDTNDLRNVEFRIQSDRILTVLDRCIANIEVGFYLPILLASSDPSHLKVMSAVTTEERAKLQMAYDQFVGEPVNKQELSKVLLDQILYLAKKYELHKYCPFETNEIPLASSRFLERLRELRHIAKFRITWTAPKAMAKEKRLHAMWKENEVTRAKVEEMHKHVARDRVRMGHKLEANETQLKERSATVRELEQNNLDQISNTIYVSNLKMNKIFAESMTKQKALMAEANEIQAEYEAMLVENLAEGKRMREIKSKEQQKVQAWLVKYDTDVGERSKELFKLKDQLEEENLNLEKWMKKYDEQEIEYNEVMELIRAEQIRIRDEKVRIFSMNYAARVIQRAVRRMIKKRKQKKKKGKKGKK